MRDLEELKRGNGMMRKDDEEKVIEERDIPRNSSGLGTSISVADVPVMMAAVAAVVAGGIFECLIVWI